MTYIIPLEDVRPEDHPLVGGKASTLALLVRHGLNVPSGLAVTVHAYRDHVEANGLGESIRMELGRKRFEDMRWEEIWDAALRIRNRFLRSSLPASLEAALRDAVAPLVEMAPVVVRSSAPGEDAEASSFAGLHESYVNVQGVVGVLDAVRRVWASLWSDAALLYRRELGLEVETSDMAVLIQEIVVGERSGVAFGRSPNDPGQAVIEGVHGLNEGLVDGRVEPDRWTLDRTRGDLLLHAAPERESAVLPDAGGTRLQPLPEELRGRPPLDEQDVLRVFELARTVERLLGVPQDVEWTFRGPALHVLQARPITTLTGGSEGDPRPWYLSLRRSVHNLEILRARIETEILPGMDREAKRFGEVDPADLNDAELPDEIRRRNGSLESWTAVYWDECIPFAHGVRLFGHIYNDAVRPEDPFEFIGLLSTGDLLSVGRNRELEALAELVRKDGRLRESLSRGERFTSAPFESALEDYLDRYGEVSCHEASCTRGVDDVLALVLKLAELPPSARNRPPDRSGLERGFLDAFDGGDRADALRMLELARASYRLRDDDNLYLGRIQARLMQAADEGKARLSGRIGSRTDGLEPLEVAEALEDPAYVPREREETRPSSGLRVEPRQLVGQPAGPGLASGRARVILEPGDLRAFEGGEVLVCDAVDPNMTAVVPLAAGIVERRGGMLIHGAIIAREYGLPCVTGVPDATALVRTGDAVTVDGFLGIVTVDRAQGTPP